jgi:serine/threonine-protein kinase
VRSRPDVAPLSASRWAILEPLLDDALAQPPREREAWIAQACASDPHLRKELLAMVAECEQLEEASVDRRSSPAFARDPDLDAWAEVAALQVALRNRYEIRERLGAGGMGVVYHARDVRHDRSVALKLLRPELSGSRLAERFRQEIRLTAKLRHPRILPVYDSGEAGDRLYYVMPLMSGGTLRERLATTPRLGLDEAVTLLRAVTDALAYAHRRGIRHRDIKPENVLLDESGAVLADFGIASALHGVAEELGVHDAPRMASLPGVGTPAYLAPEGGTSGSSDHRADLYALGVLAYEVLVGRHPFDAATAADMHESHRRVTPRALRADRREIPADLERLVLQLLEKEANRRPRDADEVLRRLEAWRASAPPSERRASPSAPPGARIGWLLASGFALSVAAIMRSDRSSDRSTAGITRPTNVTDRARIMVAAEGAPLEDNTTPLGGPSPRVFARSIAETVREQLTRIEGLDIIPAIDEPRLNEPRDWRARARAAQARFVVRINVAVTADSVFVRPELRDVGADRVIGAMPVVRSRRDTGLDQLSIVPTEAILPVVAAAVDIKRPLPFATPATMPRTYAQYEAYVDGMRFFSQAQWDSAVVHLRKAWGRDSDFVAPMLTTADAYQNLRAPARADSIVRALERRRSRLSPVQRANLARQRALLDGDVQGELVAAREYERELPGDPLAHYLHARQALLAGRPREALAAASGFETSLGGPETTTWLAEAYWSKIADAYHALEGYRAEGAAMKQAVALHPESALILARYLRALAAQGHWDLIRPDLPRLSALRRVKGAADPASQLHYLAVEFRAHGAAGLATEAVALGLRTLTLQDTSAAGRRTRARLLFELNRNAEGLALLTPAIRNRSPDVTTLALLGTTYARLGDRRRAVTMAERLRQAPPAYDHGWTTFSRARIAALIGDRTGAVALLHQARREGYPYDGVWHALPELVALRAEPGIAALLRPIE